ncbi:TetR/AcrR family transcriptional regulator [Thermomonospora cellulosilytica]|uniref:AcrR family transcriptional regulator n=1 Tax=Thermomonospora cellulosilytica TaxID=1411118 RepID=A0A7W3N4S0_9ACTN|nr:TetR/AcrR family transcriptional regulator [Thermomonospora cellulosilytica]MBA9007549.1 AcrR family transcriptional regulator [Thermomonospora cellulosilytica]
MAVTRRDRLRAATVQEIVQTARRLLVEHGPDAVTLRGVAREMQLTAPALYRYFGSHEELLKRVIGELFGDLADHVRDRITAVPPGDLSGRFLAASRGFREWALAHRREYALLFGNPMPGVDVDLEDHAANGGRRLGWVYLSLYLELWNRAPFPVRSPEGIDPGLRAQLDRYRDRMGVDLPSGAMLTFLRCWTRLQGAVSLEVLGHLSFALDDPEPLFELMLTELAAELGLEYRPPDGP